MTRDQALAKIKKCLSLGKSANPNEAAAAMRQAQKLMSEHRINDRELSLMDIQEVPIKACSVTIQAWEASLARMVADAFGCNFHACRSGRMTKSLTFVPQLHYVFIGVDTAATVAGYAFESLARQCAKDRLAHIKKQPKNCKPVTKTARGDTFARGWVFAVSKLIEKFANPDDSQALLLAYKADKYPDLKNVKPRDASVGRKLGDGHLWAGHQAGNNAQLHRAVGSPLQQELLA